MVPSRTSSAIFSRLLKAAQRACGLGGTRECVVEAGLGKGNLALFVLGGEGLELSRIQALADSHGPDVGVLQASPRQHHGTNRPPCDQSLRLAEGEEKVALLVGVAGPAVHDLAELKPTNKRNKRAFSVLNRKPRPFLRKTKRRRDPSADLLLFREQKTKRNNRRGTVASIAPL